MTQIWVFLFALNLGTALLNFGVYFFGRRWWANLVVGFMSLGAAALVLAIWVVVP